MKVFVCNIGSSSLKFQFIEIPSEALLARGQIERVGSENAKASLWIGEEQIVSRELTIRNQGEAVRFILDCLTTGDHKTLSLDAIDGIGFKCVQAGEKNGSVLLSQDVLDAMEYYRDLAPAHNPPYLEAIYMFQDLLPETPLVGVFEPGFHTQAPDYAKVYGTPYEWIRDFGVKKYGYHGASHRYVTANTVRLLELAPDNHKVITCHLGGSSSLCAFKNGVAVDTSMGFTPQSGLIQGTRIGDLDPFVLPYVMRKKGISFEEALLECSKNGGLAGLSGTSGDMRDINRKISEGSRRALLARNKFIYDIKRYIGEFLLLMEGLDAITFTGGIGQKDATLRAEVLSSLAFLGLELDETKNMSGQEIITKAESAISAVVMETREELVVARETTRVITSEMGADTPNFSAKGPRH